jgi:hypothetical protein
MVDGRDVSRPRRDKLHAVPNEPCPKAAAHTPCPSGYLAWDRWAEQKAKTHRQIKCEGCGLYAIWVPKLNRQAHHGAEAMSSQAKRGVQPVPKEEHKR